MKLIVLGEARWGKDTVAEIICREYGMTFESSSAFVAEEAVRPALAAHGIVYDSYEAMYADRVNHRPKWKAAILAYNTPDLTKLGRKLFAIHDIYCGLRERTEFVALKEAEIIDFTIWVDASKRCPPEGELSCTVTPDMADYILDNNGPESGLHAEVHKAMAAAQAAMKSRAA
ncbi:MAG: cof, RDJLphi1 gp18 [Rhizobium sp.]|nr:cof, RDJLphi1 gp18 [Rhizobium sp.]